MVEAEVEMLCDDFFASVRTVTDSFPDMVFKWESITPLGNSKYLIKNFTPSGTHTGAPFAFGPYPAIAATNIHAELPCDLHLTLRGNQVCESRISGEGELIGPPGFYVKIGGILM